MGVSYCGELKTSPDSGALIGDRCRISSNVSIYRERLALMDVRYIGDLVSSSGVCAID
jgi:hypothetical protein